MMGRRVSYLDPIRMYIFTSAIFFLIFFSMINLKNVHFGSEAFKDIQNDSLTKELLPEAKNAEDSAAILKLQKTPPVVPKIKDSSADNGNTNFNVGTCGIPYCCRL